jgi:amino acid adenylation domain-containing protein
MKFNSLHSEIDKFAKEIPEKIAIECGEQRLTYRELYLESNRIAYKLAKNDFDKSNVALIMDRSIEMVISLIGVMKVGRVFIPIDPSYPSSRIEYMLDNSNCETIVTTENCVEKLSNIFNQVKNNLRIIVVNREKDNIQNVNEEFNYIYNEKCYIYFSSGSTGKPKGILGKHSSLKQFIQWEIEEFGIDSNFRVSQISSPSFDAYLRDIFIPLIVGGTLCIPENIDIILNPLKLVKWMDKENITLTHMVKTLFVNMMGELNDANLLKALKYILVSGESLKGTDIKKCYELFKGRIDIINLYGATETTLIKTFYKVGVDDVNKVNIPIGKPIDGAKIHILNDNLEECKQGECGEIYIESNYMTFGYHKDSIKTREKFIKSHLSKKSTSIIYKTGDIGRRLEDGNYECLGRIDRQIKINGIRIEPGEIENTFKNNFKVSQVIVTSLKMNNGKVILVAYYSGSQELNDKEIKHTLSKHLPTYMIPTTYTYVSKMPLLPNGKINIKELFTIKNNITSKQSNYYFDKDEKKVSEVICNVLGLESIDANEDFFKLGGNSLDAAQVALRLYKKYNFEILVSDIFKRKTIKNIAEYIKKVKDTKYMPIQNTSNLDRYPLTPGQKGIFLLSRMQDVGISYNLPEIIEIRGKINSEDINLACKELLKQEEVLRTSFKMFNEEPVQIINDDVEFNIPLIDYSYKYQDGNLNSQDIKEILKEFIKEFDLKNAPLIRMYLIKVAEEKYLLLIDMHHIIADGISQELIKYKLSYLINRKSVERAEIKYKDYSVWMDDRLKSDRILKMKDYWMSLYENDIPILEMPTDFNRPVVRSFNGGNVIKFLDRSLSKKIREFSAQESKTVYTCMLSVFIVLLNKYTSQDDIVIGTVVSGRNHPDIEKIIGMFVNTIPLRVKITGCEKFVDLLEKVSNNLLFAMENQEYPFEKIVEVLKIKPKLDRNQLFDVMFIMTNIDSFKLEIEGTSTRRIIIEEERSKFDITLTVYEEGEDIYLNFEYSTDLFKASTIERMANHYEKLLNQFIDNGFTNINECSMIPNDEKEFVLSSLKKDKNSNFNIEKTFIDLFKEQVNKNPDNIAITFKETTITYKELDIASDYLVKMLESKCVEDNSIIAIMMTRTPLLFISMIAILKLGCTYLPIDPTYPADRIKYMIEDSECSLILCDDKDINEFEVEVINLELRNVLEKDREKLFSINKSKSDKVAYVTYTSGSTGEPKGVMITNKNISSFISSIKNEIEFTDFKKILSLTTISFDIFVLESLFPLAEGLGVVLVDEEDQYNPYNIKNILEKNKIDILQVTPSRLSMIIESLGVIEFLKNIKVLIIGGEQFPKSLLKKLKLLKGIRIFNVYGPTEATVWCSIKELTNENKITIGKPFSNTEMYILNENHQLQPIGVPGELYISGDCLAKGYINKEDITKERFISNPFESGHVMYRTGDIVKLLENGEMEFIGRVDFQVKLRGYRVELNEIEKCISNLGVISNCICDVREDSNRGQYLVAYYEANEFISISDMRESLSKTLPYYMIPDIFMQLDKLPITKNGKIDRKNLPIPEETRPMLNNEYKKSDTKVENEILSIWQFVLGINNIGINDNFFELGGNSLLLVRMHNKLQERYGEIVSIADVFSYPTIFSLAKYITSYYKESKKIVNTIILPKDYFNVIQCDCSVNEYEFTEDFRDSIMKICKSNSDLESFMMTFYVYLFYRITGNESLYFNKIIDSHKGIFSRTYVNISLHSNFTDLVKFLLIKPTLDEMFLINDIGYDEVKNRKGEIATVFSVNKSVSTKAKDIFDLITIVENGKTLKIKCYFNSSKINSSKVEELLCMYINLVQRAVREEMYKGGF